MAKKYHSTNQFCKRALALSLALATAIGSWSVDWNTLHVQAVGFDVQDEWRTTGEMITQEYTNTGTSYETITGVTLHMADMVPGDVVSFAVSIEDADTGSVLSTASKDGVTAVGDVTISGLNATVAPNKKVFIYLTFGGDVVLYTDGSNYMEVATSAMATPPSSKVYIDEATTILTTDQTGQIVASEKAYGRAITYESNAPSVLAVDASGTITPVGPGKATVTAKTSEAGDTPASVDVTVVQVSFGTTDLTYTGMAQAPSVTVEADKTLVAGVDYSVTGSATNVGESSAIVVEGKGDYAGFSASSAFSVSQTADIATASGGKYTIDTKTSDVTAVSNLKLANGYELVYGTDFTATAERTGSDNSDGTYKHVYTVTLEGMGNFSGTKVETDIKVTADVTTPLSDVYTLEMTTADPLYAGQVDRDEVLRYVVIKNSKGKTVSKNGFTFTLSDENLNTPGTVTVTATYAELYDGEISTEFVLYGSIGATTTTATIEKSKWVYTGNPITPNVVVKSGTTTLKKDTDYTVSYSANTDVGEASIRIVGRGSYTGSRTVNFTIVPSVQDAVVTVGGNSTKAKKSNGFVSGYSVLYDGSVQEPSIQLSVGGYTLVKDDDFTVVYDNNTNASSQDNLAVATITTKADSACGTQVLNVYFTIEAVSISGGTLTVDESSNVYTGEALELPVTLKVGTKTLVKDTDYTVEYSNNVDASAFAFVSVTGKGNYKDSLSKNFTIAKRSISGATITFKDAYSYTGSAVQPVPESVVVDGITLEKGVDYADAITYENNVKVGTAAKATIEGIGNFKGTASQTFTITPRSIIGPQITYAIAGSERVSEGDDGFVVTGEGSTKIATYASSYSAVYTGRANKPQIQVIDGDTTLKPATDYVVTYGSSVNAGTVTVVITGSGNYKNTGTIKITYTITPCALDDATRISVDASKFVPGTDSSVEIVDAKRKTTTSDGKLTLDTDYAVSWGDWNDKTEAGPNKVMTITGKGNYTGTREVTYNQGIDIGAPESKGVLTIDDYIKGTFTENGTYQDAKKYDVYYLGGKSMEECLPRIRVAANQTDLKDGEYDLHFEAVKENGYDAGSIVKVTATGKGTKYYGELTAYYEILPVTLDTTNLKIKFDGDADYATAAGGMITKNYDYSGETITPAFTATYMPINKINNTELPHPELVLGKDYTYEPPTINGSIGTTGKTGTIKGLGPNFVTTSSVEIGYTVGAANLNDAVISDIPAQEYKAGTPSDPTITVTYKGKTLVRGTDYTVNYNGTNEKEGTATATITGIGNYTGEVTKQFEIVQKKLTKDTTTIVLKSSSKKYTGSALTLSSTGSEPEIIVRYNNQDLVEGTDYKLEYENNVNPGQAKITVKGKGDYGDDGTAVTNFDIYLDLTDTNNYKIEGIPADKELVYYGENVWKQKSDTSVAFSANDLKIYTEVNGVKHYLKDASAESYAALTSNLTQPTTGGTITINGAGANKYCVGSRTVDNIRVYIDASLLTVEGMANVYPYTGYEVKPGNTSSLRVLYGNRELTKGTEFTFEYDKLQCSDLISVDTGTTTNANVRAVYIQGNESRMFTGRSKDYPYSIKYDLSKATATGWKTTYTYTEIQNAATAAGKTVESYRPKPVMEFKDSTGTTVSIPTGSYSAEYASSMGDGAAFNSAGAIVNVIVGPLGTNSYCYNTKTLSYTITGIDTANHLNVELEANSFEYTGSKIEPNIVNVRYNGTDLQSSDYTVQYANNVDVTTEASKAKVLVTGIGNYKGTTVVEFQITPKNIAETGSSVEPDFPRVVYTGNNIKAEELGGFVLRDTANGKVLKPGADQDFTFSVLTGKDAGTEAGKVSVTMNAGGNYKGTATYKFDIDQLNLSDASLSVSKSAAEYTGQPIDIAIELTMKLNGASEAVKLNQNMYEVTYNGQSSVVDIGTYDIVIQPKTGNDNVVGSNSATFTVTGRWIGTSDYQLYEDDDHKYTLTFDGVDYADPLEKNYTGDPVEPIVVLKDKDHNNNEPLVKDRDYTVTYKNNVDSTDSAEVIVEGIGNYYGIVKKTFAIGKNMGDGFGELSQPLDKVYNGAPQKQDGLKVLVDGKTLVENRDYKLSYSDDITNAGTVTVTATAIGTSGYYGTLSKTYQIKPKNIEYESMVQIIPNLPKDANNSYYADYTGSKITPEVSVYVDNNGNDSFAESEKLTTDDYDVSYGDDTQNIKAGNGLIWVTFKRNYQLHTSERNFLIIGSELSEATTHVVVNDDYYTYTGSEIIPNLTVYQDLGTGRRVELSADDYTLELENNVNPGDATVTVKGRNSFFGSAKATFVIAADLSTIFTSDTTSGLDLDADGTLDNTCKVPKQLYTGSALTPMVDAVVGGKALRQNSDYMIGNVQLGTPDSEGNPTTGTVDITGNNKYYRGKYTASFEVTTDLSQIKLSYQGLDDVIYTGRAHKPNDFKVLDPSGNEVNYDITGVTYVSSTDGDDCINVGTVTVTIPITIGTVSSTVKTTYAIKPANIGAAEYTGGANCTYSGSPLQPPVVLYYYGEALQAGKDYEIVYDNNTLPTSKTSTGATPDPATITITGIGNFTGSYYQEFQIYPERMREVAAKPVGANGMLVSWDKLNHVSGYRVDVMSTGSNVPVKTVDVSNPSATSTTIAGLDEGTTYSFRAYSYVTVNDTTYYGLLNSITTSTGISTPQISTSSNKAKQATLTWRVGNSGAKYMIYRSDTANGEYKFIARTTTDATSFTDVGLTRGRTYYYKIRAYRYPNEYGEYSDVSAVTVK